MYDASILEFGIFKRDADCSTIQQHLAGNETCKAAANIHNSRVGTWLLFVPLHDQLSLLGCANVHEDVTC
jgi:hypothetical protein